MLLWILLCGYILKFSGVPTVSRGKSDKIKKKFYVALNIALWLMTNAEQTVFSDEEKRI